MKFRQPARLKPLIAAIASVAAAVIVLDLLLSLCFGAEPTWLPAPFDVRLVKLMGTRLARIQQMDRYTALQRRHALIVILGTSTVREDFSPSLLEANDPQGRGWVTLGGSGSTFRELEGYTHVLFDSPVKPSLLALGIHASMLGGFERVHHPASLHEFAAGILHHQPRRSLYGGSWLYRNRDALADWSDAAMPSLAARVRRLFGLPMSAAYEPESDPSEVWTEYTGLKMPQNQLDTLYAARKASLVPALFENAGIQIDALSKIVAEARAQGTEVVFLLMPDSSPIRTLYSAQLESLFQDAITKSGAGNPVRQIDLRTAIPDDMFYDYWHLNVRGREELSQQLPALLK